MGDDVINSEVFLEKARLRAALALFVLAEEEEEENIEGEELKNIPGILLDLLLNAFLSLRCMRHLSGVHHTLYNSSSNIYEGGKPPDQSYQREFFDIIRVGVRNGCVPNVARYHYYVFIVY